jgi:hypothetical protein
LIIALASVIAPVVKPPEAVQTDATIYPLARVSDASTVTLSQIVGT